MVVNIFRDFKKCQSKFDLKLYNNLKDQHNILVLVGNGFDIAALKKIGCRKLKGKTTSYQDFYEYITYLGLVDENNILYKKMKKDKEEEKDNWSDFENSIQDLISDSNNIIEIEKCLDEFQRHFTLFLNDLVDSDVLLELNSLAIKKKLSIRSLSKFLYDLDDIDQLAFVDKTKHYDLFDFTFINFNYTFLLDNYLYLDKYQFDPHRHKYADRNFSFKFQLPKWNPTIFSSYIMTEILHPHGIQTVPRSILFGVDLDNYDRGLDDKKRLVKGYWSQYKSKYKSYLLEAELFIIYGMSLGRTDAWWYDNIFDALLLRKSELIIYMHGNASKESVKGKFIDGCVRHANSSQSEKEDVMKRIYVVTFENNDTFFLGFE